MQLTDEQKKSVEEYAGLFLQPTEIAMITEIDESFFLKSLKNSNSEIYKLYYKGLFTAIVKLRKVQMDFALKGSQSNILQMENYVKELIINL